MSPTFKIKNINGVTYQLLTLPGTNLFTHRIISHMGAHIEKAYFQKYNKNVYGISHLVEHLSFRASADFTTDELMNLLKKEGTYNASTCHEYIDYFFKTSMERRRLASQLVCNYAFNDLSRISDDEFNIERSVVINEINRYADEPQTMFYYNNHIPLSGYHDEDNVLGSGYTVSTITLSDAKQIKNIFLGQKHIHALTYDPLYATESEIIDTVGLELDRWKQRVYIPDNEWETLYNDSIVRADTSGEYEIVNASKQHMVSIRFAVNTATLAHDVGTYYLATDSHKSLTDIIREKYGLTYGIYFYTLLENNEQYSIFSCDVESDKVDILMTAIEESFSAAVAAYTQEEHDSTLSSYKLQRILKQASPEVHNSLHNIAAYNPEQVEEYKDIYAKDIIAAYDARLEKDATFDNVNEYIISIKEMFKNKEYSIVTNKK